MGTTLLALLLALVPHGQSHTSPARIAFAERAIALASEINLTDIDEEHWPTPDAVRDVLGPPDLVMTPESAGWDEPLRIREIWLYGTTAGRPLGTLGAVVFTVQGDVEAIYGASAPARDLPPEEVLRPALACIDRVRGLGLGDGLYDPGAVIAAVNALVPLGRAQALAVLDEYARVSRQGRDRTILVALALFEPTPGESLPQWLLPWGELRGTFPHYPIVMADDIPYFLFPLGGWGLGGGWSTWKEELDDLRAHGTFRSRPLVPPDDPTAAEVAFLQSPAWRAGLALVKDTPDAASAAQALLAEQTLLLLTDVYRPAGGDRATRCGLDRDPASIAARRREISEAIGAAGVRWNPTLQRYELADGSTLPPPPAYQQHVWRAESPGRVLQVVVQRSDDDSVDVTIESDVDVPTEAVPARKVAIETWSEEWRTWVPRITAPVVDEVGSSTSGWGDVRIAAGTRVRAVIVPEWYAPPTGDPPIWSRIRAAVAMARGDAPLATSPIWVP